MNTAELSSPKLMYINTISQNILSKVYIFLSRGIYRLYFETHVTIELQIYNLKMVILPLLEM